MPAGQLVFLVILRFPFRRRQDDPRSRRPHGQSLDLLLGFLSHRNDRFQQFGLGFQLRRQRAVVTTADRQIAQLQAGDFFFTLVIGQADFQVGVVQFRDHVIFADPGAGLQRGHDLPGRTGVNPSRLAGANFKRSIDVMGQRYVTDRGDDRAQDRQGRKQGNTFHFREPPRSATEFPGLNHGLCDQTKETNHGDHPPDDLQTVRFQDFDHEPTNREHDDPAVDHAGNREQSKHEFSACRQERIVLKFQAETGFLEPSLQDFGALLPQVGDLQEVHHDVVAVKTQQRISVDQDGADDIQEHHVQTQVVDRGARFGEPPDKRRDRRQDHFDIDSRGADPDSFPFVRQHPRVGNVAIQTGREDQQHEADFVAFAAELLAAQPVPEFVHHLHDRHRHRQDQPAIGGEELLERRQPRINRFVLAGQQQRRGGQQQTGNDQHRNAEHPAEPRQDPVENSFRVKTAITNRKQVADFAHQLLVLLGASAFPQRFALAGRVADHQPAAVQHADELLQVAKGDLLRCESLFKAVFVPTTLLAMVDASVGGKTGVDLGPLKNQIGIINSGDFVLVDTDYLITLPKNQLNSGVSEMLKHGLITSDGYWSKMKNYLKNSNNLDKLIHESIEIKGLVVEKDQNETGIRKSLNFGHTLGHAIESYFLENTQKKELLHGEAIAIGMILETYISLSY